MATWVPRSFSVGNKCNGDIKSKTDLIIFGSNLEEFLLVFKRHMPPKKV